MPLLELPEGVWKTGPQSGEDARLSDFLAQHKNSHNVTIIGKGPGVTEIHGKVRLDGWFPNLSHLAHYPDENQHPGWSLLEINNPGTFRIADFWSHPPAGAVGIVVRTTDWGVVAPNPFFPDRRAPIGGARISNSAFRDIYVYGEGRGISLDNQTTLTDDEMKGQFTNHVRIFGGHIFTTDIALGIGGGVKAFNHCLIEGFHIDVKCSGCGLRFGEETSITWIAPGFVEPTSGLRASGGQIINGPVKNLTVLGGWPTKTTV